MSYIYTVKPIQEAIKIAVKHDDFTVGVDGKTSVFGVDVPYWPAGVQIRSAKPINTGYIKVGKSGFSLALRYFTETEEKEPVPEFIKGLYEAMIASCAGVHCEKCPLNITGDCTSVTQFIRDEWGIE